MKTKVLSVVANSTERSDSGSFGLVRAIESAVNGFVESEKATLVDFELAGTAIDSGSGSAQDPQAVFGRTLVVVHYEVGSKKASKAKK